MEPAESRNLGAKQVSVEKPGMGFKVPFKDQIEEVVVRTQSTKISTKAGSIDLQEVTVGASVNWRITESSLLNFYKTIGIDPVVIEEKYIKPKTVSAMKTALGKYKAEQMIITREDAKSSALAIIKSDLAKFGIEVEDFTMEEIDLDPELRRAVTSKQVAVQNKLKAETDLERIRIESEQKVVVAEAEAKSLSAQKSEITSELLDLRRIEVDRLRAQNESIIAQKWNGQVPQTFYGSSPLSSLKALSQIVK